MKIALIGATGFVGSAILKEALRREHAVTAIVRDPKKLSDQETRLSVKWADVLDTASLADAVRGHDLVVSAYNAGWKNPNLYTEFLEGSRSIQQACTLSAVHRLLVVGGAGSLELKPGEQLVDDPHFPAEWKEGALAARDYLRELKRETELDWVFLSPAMEMHPGTSGVRTGRYQTGFDQPVFNEQGESRISVEDVAVAVLDEAERPQFHRQRFTVGW